MVPQIPWGCDPYALMAVASHKAAATAPLAKQASGSISDLGRCCACLMGLKATRSYEAELLLPPPSVFCGYLFIIVLLTSLVVLKGMLKKVA